MGLVGNIEVANDFEVVGLEAVELEVVEFEVGVKAT